MSKPQQGDASQPSDSRQTVERTLNPSPLRGSSSASHAGPSRVVGNQAKKQDEVTRLGTQKMKFVPTLPVRRKKAETEPSKEDSGSVAKPVEQGRGRGFRSGRGRGGGHPPGPRPEVQMTASGPFAMGPALGGTSKRRVPRSNFNTITPTGASTSSLGDGLSNSSAPTLNREGKKSIKSIDTGEIEDIEVYSDPDEGVQIVDMDAVKTMDWMAPESLKREHTENRSSKKRKAEAVEKDIKKEDIDDIPANEVQKNLENALDLSESDEEEEIEDLVDDFASYDMDMGEDPLTRPEKLYFFQFPHPFPTFAPVLTGESRDVDPLATDQHKPESERHQPKKVTFAQDVKPPAPDENQGRAEKADTMASNQPVTKSTEETKLDGVIGQLEVHRSGVIKMRLENGTLMDVTAATQPSFLQHAVFLDPNSKKMYVLGEVNRRFVVSPDVDRLLEEMDKLAAESIKDDIATEAQMDTR